MSLQPHSFWKETILKLGGALQNAVITRQRISALQGLLALQILCLFLGKSKFLLRIFIFTLPAMHNQMSGETLQMQRYVKAIEVLILGESELLQLAYAVLQCVLCSSL